MKAEDSEESSWGSSDRLSKILKPPEYLFKGYLGTKYSVICLFEKISQMSVMAF